MISIVFQGPTNFCDKLEVSKKFETIFSTWDDEPQKNISILENKGFKILTNKKPIFNGFHNINLQTKSSLEGIKKCSNDYILKIRSDILINDLDRFTEFLLKKNKMSFLAYHDHNNGYVCDYLNFGNKNDMFQWWNYTQNDFKMIPPEIQLLENYSKIKNISNKNFEEIKKHFYFFLGDLNINAFSIYWMKMNLNFKDYLSYKEFKY